MSENNHDPEGNAHPKLVARVGKLEGRVGTMEPMVTNHDNLLYRGIGGQPSIVAHIADTNTKLDYNNKRLDDLVSIADAVLKLFQKIGWSAIRTIAAILVILALYGVFGGTVKQEVHKWFPSFPVANSLSSPSKSGVDSGKETADQ